MTLGLRAGGSHRGRDSLHLLRAVVLDGHGLSFPGRVGVGRPVGGILRAALHGHGVRGLRRCAHCCQEQQGEH